jgi:hypothetical protein
LIERQARGKGSNEDNGHFTGNLEFYIYLDLKINFNKHAYRFSALSAVITLPAVD